MICPLLPSPYSDGQPFTVMEMETISFCKLVAKDPEAVARLLAAGERDGFFYLDLSGRESDGLWDTYEKCLAVMAAWFEQPLENKVKFAYNSDVHGYKHMGSQAGLYENLRDGFESMRVDPNSMSTTAKQPPPAAVVDNEALISNFIRTSKYHDQVLLSAFSDAHDLHGPSRYEAFHKESAPSNSSISFHRYPQSSAVSAANVGHNEHTDVGSLTMLFASQWGLQAQSYARGCGNKWEWVRPRPGFAVCNIGDSLRFMSGMRLRSLVHRVVPSADQERGHRYSVGWFCRPAHGTMFHDSEGRLIKSNDWFAEKFHMMRANHAAQRGNTIMTGGMGDVGNRA